ncbi:hypothetical protein B0H13DRAFT_2328012 [Mycena leptocephala]|nr:hypothetical protein B0H13DRAFT_2328012 [Mycena leptocephala]
MQSMQYAYPIFHICILRVAISSCSEMGGNIAAVGVAIYITGLSAAKLWFTASMSFFFGSARAPFGRRDWRYDLTL